MDNLRICCLSDTHGYLPEVPQCDLLLIGGDICPAYDHSLSFQKLWVIDNFLPWLEKTPAKQRIYIAGNHDFIFEKLGAPQYLDHPMYVGNKAAVKYLQDSSFYFPYGGLKIYGTPWQPYFFNWAFNLNEAELARKWDRIPEDTDILVVHGPPYGCGDKVRPLPEYPRDKAGSPSLLKKIEVIKPKLVVTGHIHSGYGMYNVGETLVVNASYVGEDYKPRNPIVELEYNRETKRIFSRYSKFGRGADISIS
jgi:hypothetical protein